MSRSQPYPGHSKLNSYVSAAQKYINEAEQLIIKATRDKNPKSKELSRRVLSAIKQVIPVVETVADVHPAVKLVATTFKALYKMEMDRAANDNRIVVMHYTASLSMFSLRHVAKLDIHSSDIEQDFKTLLKKFDQTLKDFGNFVSPKQSIVRLVHASEHKKKLEGFSKTFHTYVTELHNLVGMHSAVEINGIQAQLYNADGKLDNILTSFEKAPSQKEREAAEVIAKNGAESVLHSLDLLQEVATKLGETLTGDVLTALHESIGEQMSKNQKEFMQNIDSGNASIKEAVDASKKAIIKHLDEGPHELITDQDIKTVWQTMKWRNSVKCRVFVDAIHDCYTKKFAEYLKKKDKFHEDSWTLKILSKVIFHSTVGDAIDEDNSGFVSVTKVNHFVEQRPKSWSVPEWLAFWGLGWSMSNSDYREKIHERLEEIKDEATAVAALHKHDSGDIKAFIRLISDFVQAVVPSTDDNLDKYEFEEDEEYLEEELSRLQYEYDGAEEERLGAELDDRRIKARADVIAIMGQPRIELSLMPLLYVWLERVQEKLQAHASGGAGDFDGDFLIRDITIIGSMIHNRVMELIRVWRQQKAYVSAHVLCFCGGVFKSWYEEIQKSESILQRLEAYGEYWEDTNDDPDIYGDEQSETESGLPTMIPIQTAKLVAPQKPLSGDLDQKLQQMWSRMNGFDDRLSRIETLLLSLITGANTTTVETAALNTQPFWQTSRAQVLSPPLTPTKNNVGVKSTRSRAPERGYQKDQDGVDDDQHPNHAELFSYANGSDDGHYHH